MTESRRECERNFRMHHARLAVQGRYVSKKCGRSMVRKAHLNMKRRERLEEAEYYDSLFERRFEDED